MLRNMVNLFGTGVEINQLEDPGFNNPAVAFALPSVPFDCVDHVRHTLLAIDVNRHTLPCSLKPFLHRL